MRVAALYDIHGNLPALEAVLDDVRRVRVDRIVIGGDVVPGPMPRETVARVMSLDVPALFIRGNGDREVLSRMRGVDTDTVPERFREVIWWVARQLDSSIVDVFDSWPETVRLRIEELGEVLFCHATPRNDTDIFTRTTPEERLLSIFGRLDVRIAICGHTHMQFDRIVGRTRVVNAGSVGMPFGEAGAYWLLLGPDVQLRRTSYDLDSAAARIRQTAYPHAEEFAARNVLQPPTEREMFEAFGKAEVK
jgi:putative phosphoesterase